MNLNRLRRSRSARSAVVVCASLALLATGVTAAVSNAGAATKKTVTVTFWNAYNDVTETPVMNGIVIPAFESQNPGIIVKDDTLPYAALLQKWIASSAAGDPPDLMRSDIAWVSQLASEGTLLETSKQSWFAAMKKNLDPGPLSTNLYKGGYTGCRTTPIPRSCSITRQTLRRRASAFRQPGTR